MKIKMSERDFDELHSEGSSAINDLALLASNMGYKPFCEQLCLDNGLSVSHILEMLEDNPGMIEAMYDWVREHYQFDDSGTCKECGESVGDCECDLCPNCDDTPCNCNGDATVTEK